MCRHPGPRSASARVCPDVCVRRTGRWRRRRSCTRQAMVGGVAFIASADACRGAGGDRGWHPVRPAPASCPGDRRPSGVTMTRASARRPRSPRGRARAVVAGLRETYPDVVVPLDHQTPFQLLAAIVLSAQCTDLRVNQVTPALFAYAPDAAAMAAADPAEIERLIYSTGFFRAKARNLIAMAQAVVDRFGGQIPPRME